MKASIDHPYISYSQLKELGFCAGITTRGPWGNPDKMYQYIREEIIPPGMHLVVPHQVHGTDVVNIDDYGDNYYFEADGVMTRRADLCLSVTTADCLPLLVANPISGYFSAVHIGWRSFIGGIIENILLRMTELGMDLVSPVFHIGPGIGACCFEVGSEVAILFENRFIEHRNGSYYVDLRGAVKSKLNALGIAKQNIIDLSDCTRCADDLYYSYRRDNESQLQMVTFIFKSK